MIVGARNHSLTDIWWAQAITDPADSKKQIPNSGIEAILKKDDIQDGDKKLLPEQRTRPGLWLESCFSHSNFNGAMATRKDPYDFQKHLKKRLPFVRPPDYLTLVLNTPQNAQLLRKIRPDVNPAEWMGNEIPQYYQEFMKLLFSVQCIFTMTHTWDDMKDMLTRKSAVFFDLIDPGHGVLAHSYDQDTDEIIYVDPDPPRVKVGDWRRVRMRRAEHDRNVKSWINVYPEEK